MVNPIGLASSLLNSNGNSPVAGIASAFASAVGGGNGEFKPMSLISGALEKVASGLVPPPFGAAIPVLLKAAQGDGINVQSILQSVVAEAMPGQLGKIDLSKIANITPFNPSASSASDVLGDIPNILNNAAGTAGFGGLVNQYLPQAAQILRGLLPNQD